MYVIRIKTNGITIAIASTMGAGAAVLFVVFPLSTAAGDRVLLGTGEVVGAREDGMRVSTGADTGGLVGREDGTRVGSALGTRVGRDDGDIGASLTGASEGAMLSDGTADTGAMLGDHEIGSAVGNTDGSSVGWLVGFADGRIDGR